MIASIREREERERHPLEAWGLSEAACGELVSVSGQGPHYPPDETEIRIDTDWERMLEERDPNEDIFDRYEVPVVD